VVALILDGRDVLDEPCQADWHLLQSYTSAEFDALHSVR
jgi:hypothetical protein